MRDQGEGELKKSDKQVKNRFLWFCVLAVCAVVIVFGLLLFRSVQNEGTIVDEGQNDKQNTPLVLPNSDTISDQTPYFSVKEIDLGSWNQSKDEFVFIRKLEVEDEKIHLLLQIEMVDSDLHSNYDQWDLRSNYDQWYRGVEKRYVYIIMDDQGNIESETDLNFFFYSSIYILDVLYSDKSWQVLYIDEDYFELCYARISDVGDVSERIPFVQTEVSTDLVYDGQINRDGSIKIAVGYPYYSPGEVNVYFYDQFQEYEDMKSYFFEISKYNVVNFDSFFEYPGFLRDLLVSDGESTYILPAADSFAGACDLDKNPVAIPSTWISSSFILAGNNEVILSNPCGVYGLKPESGEIQNYVEWKNLDMPADTGRRIAVPVKRDVIFMCSEPNQEDRKNNHGIRFYLLERMPENPNTGKRILRIGGRGIADSFELQQAVFTYNHGSKDIHAEICDYLFFDGKGGVTKTYDDIENNITDNPPDVLYDKDGYNWFVRNKDIWKDLNPYLENDAEILSGDYVEHLLRLGEQEGAVPYVFSSYKIYALMTGADSAIPQNFEWGGWGDYFWAVYGQSPMEMYLDRDQLKMMSVPLLAEIFDLYTEYEESVNPFLSPFFEEIIRFLRGEQFEWNVTYPTNYEGQPGKTNMSESERDLFDSLMTVPYEIRAQVAWEMGAEEYPLDYIPVEIGSSDEFETAKAWFDIYETVRLQGYLAGDGTSMLCRPTSLFGIYDKTREEAEAWTFIKILMDSKPPLHEFSIKRKALEDELDKMESRQDKMILREAIQSADRLFFVSNDIIYGLAEVLASEYVKYTFLVDHEVLAEDIYRSVKKILV